MHELSLARNLLDQALDLAARHGAERVITITVEVGPFSGVVADSLAFGFDALKLDHPATAHTRLILECPPPLYHCPACGQDFSPAGSGERGAFLRQCPACGHSPCPPGPDSGCILKQLEME